MNDLSRELYEEVHIPKRKWWGRVSRSLATRAISASLVLGSGFLQEGYAQEPLKPASKRVIKGRISFNDVKASSEFSKKYEMKDTYFVEYEGAAYKVVSLKSRELGVVADKKWAWLVLDGYRYAVRTRTPYKQVAYAAHMARAVREGYLPSMADVEKLERTMELAGNVDLLHEYTNSATEFLFSLGISPGVAAAEAGEIGGKKLSKQTARRLVGKEMRNRAIEMVAGKGAGIMKRLALEGENIDSDRAFKESMRGMGLQSAVRLRRALSEAENLKKEIVHYSHAKSVGDGLVDGLTLAASSILGLSEHYPTLDRNPVHFLMRHIAIPFANGVTPAPVGILVDQGDNWQTYEDNMEAFDSYVAATLEDKEMAYTDKAVNTSFERVAGLLRNIVTDQSIPEVLGDRIAFTSDREGDNGIYIMRSDGKNQRKVIGLRSTLMSVSWSPDGDKLVFASARNGHYEICVVDADGSNFNYLTENNVDDTLPSWSPRGKIVFVSDIDGNDEIYTINSDGSGKTRLTHHPESDSYPLWSPDGRNIAFVSTRDSDNYEVFVMRPDGSNVRKLTRGGCAFTGSWSPDSESILYTLLWPNEIYIAHLNGTASNLTQYNTFTQQPSWSSSGKIAFVSKKDGNEDIYVMNADGSGKRRLTFNKAHDLLPRWSPDGRIAFVSGRDGNDEIYTMNSDGSDQRRLTNNRSNDCYPVWSPQRINYLSKK